MRGNLLEAYCALAKADCHLEFARTERNEQKIDELRANIQCVQIEIGYEGSNFDLCYEFDNGDEE